ncbi:hypothetical protein ACFEMC_04125 [Kineococcus sp. DHX-1]|uniref:hypothetical protein n=1 Tax=Kineococcus sp. DHX-1 TaxID=3349638 RepID=UPI0036D272EA
MITSRPRSDAPWRTRRAVAVLTSALAAAAAVGACSGGGEPDPAPTTTTVEPAPVSTTSASPAATSSGPVFDCVSVQAAQTALDDAYASELDRLGIKRGDPRAQSVFTIVTTNEGPEYYAAVLAAAPPDATADAQVVLDYYTKLATQAGTVDVGTGSAEDLGKAMDALDAAGAAVNPDPSAATSVVQAQERLQADVDRECSGAATSTGTSSPSTTSS